MESIDTKNLINCEMDKFDRLIKDASNVMINPSAEQIKVYGNTIMIHDYLMRAMECLTKMEKIEIEAYHKEEQPMFEYWK